MPGLVIILRLNKRLAGISLESEKGYSGYNNDSNKRFGRIA